MYETVAWGRKGKGEKFERMSIQRNLPGDDDVTFDLKYCGICHTDVHFANNDMGNWRLIEMVRELKFYNVSEGT